MNNKNFHKSISFFSVYIFYYYSFQWKKDKFWDENKKWESHSSPSAHDWLKLRYYKVESTK